MKRSHISIILVSFFIVLGIVFGVYYFNTYRNQPVILPTYGNPGHRVSAFSFTKQDGATITQKELAGKIYVVEYFFATCKGICPKMNEQMTRVYQSFKGNDRVKILSHTVDPQKDTAAALMAYSKQYEADPAQWYFLTGDKKELYDMARFSYLVNAEVDTTGLSIDKDFIHDNHFTLVDGKGYIRGQYDGLQPAEVNRLIGDIKSLLVEPKSEM